MKKNYIHKIILSSLALIMTTSLLLSNGQKVNADTIDNSTLQVLEKNSFSNSSYLNEDIKLINFKAENNNENINIINEKINNEINSLSHNMNTQSKDFFNEFSGEFTVHPYELNVSNKITTQSNSITSLYMDIYTFMGGAHGTTTRNAYTIDNTSKDLLSLNNLFVKGYDYKKIIDNEISKQINNNPNNYFISAINFEGINNNTNFYIDGENLVIYYQQYEIAPYCVGIPEFKIPLSVFGENYLYKNNN